MTVSGYSIEDVPVDLAKTRSLHERWRYPDIIENDTEDQTYAVIDEDGEAHYGIFAQHPSLTDRLYQTEYTLEQYRDSTDLFRTLFQEFKSCLPDIASKKEKIVYAKLIFGDEISAPSNSIFGLATCIERDYANQFKYHPETKTVSPRDQVSRSLRQDMIEETGGCVRCGSEQNIHIHHIVPYSQGGPTKQSNLAPLCRECHTIAHRSSYDYKSKSSFWEWVSNGPSTGWTHQRRTDYDRE